jgi:hypothetical protein
MMTALFNGNVKEMEIVWTCTVHHYDLCGKWKMYKIVKFTNKEENYLRIS